MSWEPRLSLLPAAPFRKNVRAAVEVHFEEALRWAEQQAGWEGDPLPNISAIHYSRAVRENYPVLNLLLLGSDPEPDADDSEQERKRLLAEFETIIGAAGEGAADTIFEQLEIYNLALRSILREMTEEELTAGIDTATRGDFRWTVGTERFGERGYDSENTYVQVGSQILTIEYTEAEDL